jgi:hypothetical protein
MSGIVEDLGHIVCDMIYQTLYPQFPAVTGEVGAFAIEPRHKLHRAMLAITA